jgi:hypothetical protein
MGCIIEDDIVKAETRIAAFVAVKSGFTTTRNSSICGI